MNAWPKPASAWFVVLLLCQLYAQEFGGGSPKNMFVVSESRGVEEADRIRLAGVVIRIIAAKQKPLATNQLLKESNGIWIVDHRVEVEAAEIMIRCLRDGMGCFDIRITMC